MHVTVSKHGPDRSSRGPATRTHATAPHARAPLTPQGMLALQRAAGNRAVTAIQRRDEEEPGRGTAAGAMPPTVVQRYTLVNPNDYILGVGSAFESQELVVGGGAAKYVTKSREQQVATVVDTVKEATGGGAWSTTANRVQSNTALPQLKYATDGTDAIGLEHTAAEPKVFFATPSLIGPSNTALHNAGSEARLVDTGRPLQAPKDPASPHGPTLALHTIKPGKTPPGQPPQVLDVFGGVSVCSDFIRSVIGAANERVAVFGAGMGHEAVVKPEKEPTQAIANFAATGAGTGATLATHLTATGTTRGEHEAPLPDAYTGMANKNARDATLGINAGAQADVGEGYVIQQHSPMPDGVTLRNWLAGLDKMLAGAQLTAAETDMFKHKWGYHYAGIVARVGNDAVSLENYNRGTVKEWALDDLYNERIATVQGLRNELETLADAGRTIPSVAKLRNQWFRDLVAELQKLGAAATADQIASRNALQQVQTAVQGLEVNDASLWHFKMYGTGAGQSFHEQWAGSVEDPMTLRIRQSGRPRKARLDASANQLEAERPSSAAWQQLAEFDLVARRWPTVSTAREIRELLDEAADTITRAALVAMRDWALDAAHEMGEKEKVVPPVPRGNAPAPDAYGQQLDTLVGGWEKQGWAVRKAGKQRLAARRQRLADLRRKIGVAAAVEV